jgi:hypothetical protein
MGIQIYQPEALHNIIRFKDRLLEIGKEHKQPHAHRMYTALLNKKTGELQFREDAPTGDVHHDWMTIKIEVETKKEGLFFYPKDLRGLPLQDKGLASLAWRVISETFETLNRMSLLSSHGKSTMALPEALAMEDLSQIQLFDSGEKIEYLPGWKGKINRVTAEHLLQGKPVGSYLFRNGDEVTEAIISQLASSNQIKIKAYLCTVLQSERMISDTLILHTYRGWTTYRDNPDLSDSEYVYFSSAHDLLVHLHKRTVHPI